MKIWNMKFKNEDIIYFYSQHLNLFRFLSHCSRVFYTSSLCISLLQTVCVCVCVCVCVLAEAGFDCVLFFAL